MIDTPAVPMTTPSSFKCNPSCANICGPSCSPSCCRVGSVPYPSPMQVIDMPVMHFTMPESDVPQTQMTETTSSLSPPVPQFPLIMPASGCPGACSDACAPACNPGCCSIKPNVGTTPLVIPIPDEIKCPPPCPATCANSCTAACCSSSTPLTGEKTEIYDKTCPSGCSSYCAPSCTQECCDSTSEMDAVEKEIDKNENLCGESNCNQQKKGVGSWDKKSKPVKPVLDDKRSTIPRRY